MTFSNLVDATVDTLINPLVALMFGLALALFFWGLVKYIWSASGSSKGEGRSLMVWGIAALFVMVTIWGLVNIIRDTFPDLRDRNLQAIPLRR